jgi:DNA-binding HxlR family transcriptional regulator
MMDRNASTQFAVGLGVTQKALTQCLRRLERNGLIERQVIVAGSRAVSDTPLGRTLQPPLRQMHEWTVTALSDVEAARTSFDLSGDGVPPQIALPRG